MLIERSESSISATESTARHEGATLRRPSPGQNEASGAKGEKRMFVGTSSLKVVYLFSVASLFFKRKAQEWGTFCSTFRKIWKDVARRGSSCRKGWIKTNRQKEVSKWGATVWRNQWSDQLACECVPCVLCKRCPTSIYTNDCVCPWVIFK